MKGGLSAGDLDLTVVEQKMLVIGKEFNLNSAEMADLFCVVSGRVDKIREYLEYKIRLSNPDPKVAKGKCPIAMWSYLEDLALKKPEDSPEFQVLIATKGMEEINARREFLRATPQFNIDK